MKQFIKKSKVYGISVFNLNTEIVDINDIHVRQRIREGMTKIKYIFSLLNMSITSLYKIYNLYVKHCTNLVKKIKEQKKFLHNVR